MGQGQNQTHNPWICRLLSQGPGIYNTLLMPCSGIEAGFYSDVVECLPVNPATWGSIPGLGRLKYFALRHYEMSNSAAAHLALHCLIMSLSS